MTAPACSTTSCGPSCRGRHPRLQRVRGDETGRRRRGHVGAGVGRPDGQTARTPFVPISVASGRRRGEYIYVLAAGGTGQRFRRHAPQRPQCTGLATSAVRHGRCATGESRRHGPAPHDAVVSTPSSSWPRGTGWGGGATRGMAARWKQPPPSTTTPLVTSCGSTTRPIWAMLSTRRRRWRGCSGDKVSCSDRCPRRRSSAGDRSSSSGAMRCSPLRDTEAVRETAHEAVRARWRERIVTPPTRALTVSRTRIAARRRNGMVRPAVRGEVVVHLPVDHRRQAGVGETRDREPAVLREVAQVLAHLRRAGRAVEPDHVGAHGVERGQRAPISVPGSMRPVSSMVTWTWMGNVRPARPSPGVSRSSPPWPRAGRTAFR